MVCNPFDTTWQAMTISAHLRIPSWTLHIISWWTSRSGTSTIYHRIFTSFSNRIGILMLYKPNSCWQRTLIENVCFTGTGKLPASDRNEFWTAVHDLFTSGPDIDPRRSSPLSIYFCCFYHGDGSVLSWHEYYCWDNKHGTQRHQRNSDGSGT